VTADFSGRLDRVVDDQVRPRITMIVPDRIRSALGPPRRTNSLVVPVRRTREGRVQQEAESEMNH